jgi:hypothetical protein
MHKQKQKKKQEQEQEQELNIEYREDYTQESRQNVEPTASGLKVYPFFLRKSPRTILLLAMLGEISIKEVFTTPLSGIIEKGGENLAEHIANTQRAAIDKGLLEEDVMASVEQYQPQLDRLCASLDKWPETYGSDWLNDRDPDWLDSHPDFQEVTVEFLMTHDYVEYWDDIWNKSIPLLNLWRYTRGEGANRPESWTGGEPFINKKNTDRPDEVTEHLGLPAGIAPYFTGLSLPYMYIGAHRKDRVRSLFDGGFLDNPAIQNMTVRDWFTKDLGDYTVRDSALFDEANRCGVMMCLQSGNSNYDDPNGYCWNGNVCVQSDVRHNCDGNTPSSTYCG